MVAAMPPPPAPAPAVAVPQCLLQPNRFSLSSIPAYSSSTSRPFPSPSVSSILYSNRLDCVAKSSLLFSICTTPSLLHFHQRIKPLAALGSDLPHPIQPSNINRQDQTLKQWDGWTAKFAAAANIPFLLLQLPQIWLNAANLMAGHYSALLAVNWLGSLTGLLANLSLLSYFAKKRETEAMIVQCLGVVTTYVMISQLAMAGAMPSLYFILTSVVVGIGVISNFFNYFGMLPSIIWGIWEDFITVGGLSVLPQVMWSTFVPYIPNSMLPGTISFVLAMLTAVMLIARDFVGIASKSLATTIGVALMYANICHQYLELLLMCANICQARTGKLSVKGIKFYGAIAGWTATLLFMWMPVPQLWTNFLNPENIKGLSSLTMLLAMAGNGLMIPRALFTRDFMWFLGSSWASFLYGWGNLLCMYLFNSISREYFFAITAGLSIWIGLAFWKDSKAYGHSSPFKSLKDLLVGL